MSLTMPLLTLPDAPPDASAIPVPDTVVLADCRWYGHHPTYFREMSQALLESGYRVLAICPRPEESLSVVRDLPQYEERFHAVGFEDPPCYFPKPRFDHDPLSTFQRWQRLTGAVRQAEEETGWKAGFVFLCWLDSFLRFAFSMELPERLGLPWSGLYFRNHHLLVEGARPRRKAVRLLKGDRLLRHRGCHAVGLLDERPAGYLEDHYGVKPVMFPDITNEELPGEPTELARRVREKAGGRTVLGMISLEPRKGFMHLLRVAEAAQGQPCYFVFTGPFKEEWFADEELAYIRQVKARVERGELSHLWLDLDGARIPDGQEYNSLMNAFDIILAVYPGWQGSSNALTKAAVFRKPVLSGTGGCMESRVRDFRLGICVDPEAGVEPALAAISRLREGRDSEGQPLNPRFADYHRLHSRGQLRRSLVEIIEASVRA